MKDMSLLHTAYLNILEPLPDDLERFEARLLEKSIYGHIHNAAPFPLAVTLPALGARRIMDILFALRVESHAPSLSVQEMIFPVRNFGILLPLNQSGELIARNNGLCQLRISEKAGRWKRDFWLDMTDINRIGAGEASCLVNDWSHIGNMKLDVFSLKKERRNSGYSESTILAPVMDMRHLKRIASGIIPWHGVDPVQDGRFGVAGHILDGRDIIYGGMDIFAREDDSGKSMEGIVLMTSIADQQPDGDFVSVMRKAWDNIDGDNRNFIIRAIADLTMTYTDAEPEKRVFHNDSIMGREAVSEMLGFYGMSLKDTPVGIVVMMGDKPAPGEDGFGEPSGAECELCYVARFARIMLHPLRYHPFLFRRRVNMNVPVEILERFVPERFWTDNKPIITKKESSNRE